MWSPVSSFPHSGIGCLVFRRCGDPAELRTSAGAEPGIGGKRSVSPCRTVGAEPFIDPVLVTFSLDLGLYSLVCDHRTPLSRSTAFPHDFVGRLAARDAYVVLDPGQGGGVPSLVPSP